MHIAEYKTNGLHIFYVKSIFVLIELENCVKLKENRRIGGILSVCVATNKTESAN